MSDRWVDDGSAALLTDLYQLTMLQAYHREQMAEIAVFDLFVRRLPPDRNYLVACGLDDVLPYLSLAVDGLTAPGEGKKGSLELRPEDVAANEEIKADTTMPVAVLGPDQLDVYGWETSLWKKIKGYLGF